MKKIAMIGCTCLLAGSLAACSGGRAPLPSPSPSDAPETDGVAAQLQVIADQTRVWQAEDESDWWGYAVTDLDQNGRLEVIASECHGTGRFTTTRIWEVREDLSGLLPCEPKGDCVPVMQPAGGTDGALYTVPVYHDGESGRYSYILDSTVQDGAFRYCVSREAVSLEDGSVDGVYLGYRNVEETDAGQQVHYQDGEGNEISAEDYDTAVQRRFEGWSREEARIRWISCTRLSDLTGGALLEQLGASFQDFSIQPLSTEELEARAAYSDLLAGEDWQARITLFQPEGGVEYALLDLDGDGVSELLVQCRNAPQLYNGVFHYGDGGVECWMEDNMETSCWDYPLADGTMVRQYDTMTAPDRYTHSYALFRYNGQGEEETVAQLALHEIAGEDGGTQYVGVIEGEEVDPETFEARFGELVTDRLPDPGIWAPVSAGEVVTVL